MCELELMNVKVPQGRQSQSRLFCFVSPAFVVVYPMCTWWSWSDAIATTPLSCYPRNNYSTALTMSGRNGQGHVFALEIWSLSKGTFCLCIEGFRFGRLNLRSDKIRKKLGDIATLSPSSSRLVSMVGDLCLPRY